MPQLDKLIILVQFKIFLILFFIVYILFVIYILPKIYGSLRLRRKKLENFLFFYGNLKGQQLFTTIEHKNFLPLMVNISEMVLSNEVLMKKSICGFFVDHLSRSFKN